jgi:NADPH:quinone reductase-like Zn-dependent oxidoreductase
MRGIHTVPIERGTDATLAETIRTRTAGKGLAALLDSVGGSLVERLFGAMQPGGTIVAYGTLSNESITVRNATLIYANLSWQGFGIDRWLAGTTKDAREHMLDALHEAIRTHRITLPVRGRFALADVRTALRSAEEHVPGKVLLQ